jgi:predicted MFS family arabinose efflux permease
LVGASMSGFATNASVFSLLLYLVIYLQNVLGHGPLGTGLRLIIMSGAMLVAGAVSGRLSGRVPARLLLAMGLACAGVGLLLMRGLSAESTWTHLIAGLIVAGIGVGILNPALASTAVDVVGPQRAGMASGINTTFRQVGIATGIAALGAVFQSRLRDQLLTGAGRLGLPGADAHRLAAALGSGHARQALGASHVSSARQVALAQLTHGSFASALNEIFLIAAILAFAGAVLAAGLVRGEDFVTEGMAYARG